ncbi:hypothetical protein ABZP36_012568 [Zizania latifolia]
MTGHNQRTEMKIDQNTHTHTHTHREREERGKKDDTPFEFNDRTAKNQTCLPLLANPSTDHLAPLEPTSISNELLHQRNPSTENSSTSVVVGARRSLHHGAIAGKTVNCHS